MQYSADLADMYEISEAKDGAIVSHNMGADCSSYSTDELIEIFSQNEIPVSKANRRFEVAEDPQVQAAEILESVDHPRGGEMQHPRSPVRFGDTPSSVRSPSPEIGEHTVEILSELGLTMDDMQALAMEGIIG